jgi:hypothetical protein
VRVDGRFEVNRVRRLYVHAAEVLENMVVVQRLSHWRLEERADQLDVPGVAPCS